VLTAAQIGKALHFLTWFVACVFGNTFSGVKPDEMMWMLQSLQLDGALVVTQAPRASVVIDGLKVCGEQIRVAVWGCIQGDKKSIAGRMWQSSSQGVHLHEFSSQLACSCQGGYSFAKESTFGFLGLDTQMCWSD
jgi:hypothetical protein